MREKLIARIGELQQIGTVVSIRNIHDATYITVGDYTSAVRFNRQVNDDEFCEAILNRIEYMLHNPPIYI